MTIPPILIAIVSLIAAGGCVFYGVTRGLRQRRAAWSWLAVPIFAHAVTYLWIAIYNPPLELRTFPVRLISFIEHGFIAYLTILLGFTNIKK